MSVRRVWMSLRWPLIAASLVGGQVADEIGATLGEHGGLARTGGRGDEDAAVNRLDRAALLAGHVRESVAVVAGFSHRPAPS